MTPNEKVKTIEELMQEIGKLMPCLDPHCDLNGTTASINRNTGEPEPEQCQYCYQERFPKLDKIRTTLTQRDKEIREEVIADIIHSWNKAEQRLDGTAQGAVNCIEQFRNTIKALKDKK